MQQIIWEARYALGIEYLRLSLTAGATADSCVIAVQEGIPFRLEYRIACDDRWRVRSVSARCVSSSGARTTTLHASGNRRWHDQQGAEHSELSGCIDVDIMATPFTNTLPIRRLAFQLGQAHTIRVAYLTVPALTWSVEEQHYTLLTHTANGAIYRFESQGGAFAADISVDQDGLVTTYPGLFTRYALQ